MHFRVIFAPTSIRDLADSVSFVTRVNPEAAQTIGDSLIDEAEEMLSQQPFIGAPCLEYEERSVKYWLHRDYRIVYEVSEEDEDVHILRFWLCPRGDWPIELPNCLQDASPNLLFLWTRQRFSTSVILKFESARRASFRRSVCSDVRSKVSRLTYTRFRVSMCI